MHAELQSILYILYILIYLYGATFCLLGGEKKATVGLDNVESEVLLRTVNPGRIPEFRGGFSEEQLPLAVFVLSCSGDVWDQ